MSFAINVFEDKNSYALIFLSDFFLDLCNNIVSILFCKVK